MRLRMPATLLVMVAALAGCPDGRPVPKHDQAAEPIAFPPDGNPASEASAPEQSVPDLDAADAADAALPPDLMPSCGPSVCAGCCAASHTCEPGTSTGACGTGGVPCASCTGTGQTCSGGKCVCVAVCANKICGTPDGCGAACAPGSGCLYLDEAFAALDPGTWSVSSGSGGTASVAGGMLTLTVPGVDGWVNVHSLKTFPVNSVLEARVNLSAGQWYDHKGLGFANHRIGANCGSTGAETEAAMWRGQDTDRYAEAATGTSVACVKVSSNYPAGWRTIKIERIGTSTVKTYEDNVLLHTSTAAVPSGALPARFSIYSFTIAPAAAITIQVDWIKVKPL